MICLKKFVCCVAPHKVRMRKQIKKNTNDEDKEYRKYGALYFDKIVNALWQYMHHKQICNFYYMVAIMIYV